MHLVDRHPQLDAAALASRFAPPSRFAVVRFSNYSPDPNHESQALARAQCASFAASRFEMPRKRWFRSAAPPLGPPGLYLDGGFGVGKTHLLASTWHAFRDAPKAYLTFTELTAFIGFAGMPAAIAQFSSHGLLCVDEFELDDVANTLMVVTFLRGYLQGAEKVAVTSNTLPDKLGEDRFSASEFRREIRAIAEHFAEFRVDGDDFRTSHAPIPLDFAAFSEGNETVADSVSNDSFPSLLADLRAVHPVQYGAMLDGVDAVVIDGLHPLESQDDALRTVHFVDKLYDARIPVRVTGCDVSALFDSSYRNGGYRKKYGRAESRLTAMAAESAGLL